MSDKKKSIQLAELCGWEVEHDDIGLNFTVRVKENGCTLFSVLLTSPSYLYNYKWMFLAWRILSWVENGNHKQSKYWYEDIVGPFDIWWDSEEVWKMSPKDAQRGWLDRVFELATEAGLINE